MPCLARQAGLLVGTWLRMDSSALLVGTWLRMDSSGLLVGTWLRMDSSAGPMPPTREGVVPMQNTTRTCWGRGGREGFREQVFSGRNFIRREHLIDRWSNALTAGRTH